MPQLPAELTRQTIPSVMRYLQTLWQETGDMTLDASHVTHIDSSGVAALARFAQQAQSAGRKLAVTGLDDRLARTLALFPQIPEEPPQPAPNPPSWFETLGSHAFELYQLVVEYVLLCSDLTWFFAQSILGRHRLRWQYVLAEMSNMGSQALGVVGLISFLVGGTVALQSAAQLRQFGASLFVADLIGVSITRELGPLMAAIVVAGRSGSAVAAEIGTMVITEEVDALRTMGIHPARFLVVPKVIAIVITQPLLTVWANTLAIFGGFLVAIFYMDVSASAFLGRLQTALYVKDIGTGLFKSLLFAFLIVTLGALCGMRTQGGADAVGRSTTTSVVVAIFAIILADATCSMVFYFN